MKCPPYKYKWRHSTAQTMTSASFSVCKYLCSTRDSDRLTKATILRSSCPSVCCDRIADNPHGDASVMHELCLFVLVKIGHDGGTYEQMLDLLKCLLLLLSPYKMTILLCQFS